LGIDIDDEMQKRKYENENDFNSIFEPHPISYTSGIQSDDKGGNPRESTDPAKEQYDKTRNEAKK
jgi:hypothetical protein